MQIGSLWSLFIRTYSGRIGILHSSERARKLYKIKKSPKCLLTSHQHSKYFQLLELVVLFTPAFKTKQIFCQFPSRPPIHQPFSATMQFTTSALSLLLLAIPASVMATSVCQPNEISVGIEETCFLGDPESGSTCRYEPMLWSDQCVSIDMASNGGDNYCNGGWGRATVDCSGDAVTSVVIDGSTYGNCYVPNPSSCASVPEGNDDVSPHFFRAHLIYVKRLASFTAAGDERITLLQYSR